MKAARDEEKDAARENMEALKMKHQREKAQELTVGVEHNSIGSYNTLC